jgi:hypothetical protein
MFSLRFRTDNLRRLAGALALALAAAAPLAAQTPAAAPNPGRTLLLGQVIDQQSKAPLASATVRVMETNQTVSTGQDGQFQVRVPAGTYNITIYRLGYETALESWEVSGASLDVGLVELSPDAVRLEALQVTADRLERARLASGFASHAYAGPDLATSSFPTVLEFITARQSMAMVPCGSMATGGPPACVRVRGAPVPVCVVVDDGPAPGGFTSLENVQTRDVARINVFRGGSFIQIYTNSFMRSIADRDWQPQNVELQMVSFCRTSG